MGKNLVKIGELAIPTDPIPMKWRLIIVLKTNLDIHRQLGDLSQFDERRNGKKILERTLKFHNLFKCVFNRCRGSHESRQFAIKILVMIGSLDKTMSCR
jgi:hypothetical protein